MKDKLLRALPHIVVYCLVCVAVAYTYSAQRQIHALQAEVNNLKHPEKIVMAGNHGQSSLTLTPYNIVFRDSTFGDKMETVDISGLGSVTVKASQEKKTLILGDTISCDTVNSSLYMQNADAGNR